jgi:Mrp family chromosome partitioning ATPase
MSRTFDIFYKGEADGAGTIPPPMPEPQADANGHADHKSKNTLLVHEEIMKLVQRVFILPGAGKTPGAVAFCGVNRGVGCSWVCARTAEMLAEQDAGSVCVVDANLRAPSLHTFFAHENHTGFADAVKDIRPITDFVRRLTGKNLWLITSGKTGAEPNGALHPGRLRNRMTELQGAFDYVLIDTPAVDAYPDAVLLGQFTDGIVLVVGSNSTRREPARIAKESFEAAKVPVFGAVLNKRTFPIPETLYRKL